MRTLLAGLLLSVTCLWGQTVNLQTALTALQNPKLDRATAAKQLADAITPLADTDRQPSRAVVDDFAKELAVALAGKKLNRWQVAGMSVCISMVIKGTVSNLQSTSHLRTALANTGITDFEIRAITKYFLAIGEDVRGPDDFRLSKVH